MENQNYTIAEDYELPSKGQIYPVPFDGKVKLRSMTVAEEMKRLNQGKSLNATLCEIIDDCLITKLPLSSYDLAAPDYEYLLHKLRVVTYGPDYKMLVGCPHCGKQQEYTANLDELKLKEFNVEEYKNNLTFKLPVCKKEIKLKIPTPRLQDTIQDKTENFNKEAKNFDGDISPLFTLETVIDSVDGSKMSYIELQELIKHMSAADYNYIIQKLEKVNNAFGLNKKIDLKCNKCGGSFSTFFRFTSEFFRPTID